MACSEHREHPLANVIINLTRRESHPDSDVSDLQSQILNGKKVAATRDKESRVKSDCCQCSLVH